MRVDLQTETHFLENRVRLVLAGLTGLDRSFVLVLAEVHELRDRRLGVRCDLDQIEIRFTGQPQRVLDANDADLLAARSDETDFRDADSVIDTWLANAKLLGSWVVPLSGPRPQRKNLRCGTRERRWETTRWTDESNSPTGGTGGVPVRSQTRTPVARRCSRLAVGDGWESPPLAHCLS
ncbi:hypothetical protein KVA01_18110 [Kocuria varians]|uniref:Uncharacterized protein n=1 Tax=Kocuria varians TaxID=1272 RepID=A0A4Y4D4X9_KOCVA|nr:hypothetical protein KVA01_18110 [Kocuria varians]